MGSVGMLCLHPLLRGWARCLDAQTYGSLYVECGKLEKGGAVRTGVRRSSRDPNDMTDTISPLLGTRKWRTVPQSPTIDSLGSSTYSVS